MNFGSGQVYFICSQVKKKKKKIRKKAIEVIFSDDLDWVSKYLFIYNIM